MSIPNSAFIKGVGAFCIVVGLVEIGIGAEVWAYVPGVKYGSWWAAMIVVVSGIVAVIANNKTHLQVMVFLSTCASILCFSGMLVDSFGYRRVNALETCVNTETGEWNGASYMQPEAAVCASQTDKLCACIGPHDVCHNFDINEYKQDNCELILTKYTDLLLISAIFTTFNLAWVFLLSIMGCVTLAKIDQPAASEKVPTSEPAAPASQPASAPSSTVELTANVAAEENPDSPL